MIIYVCVGPMFRENIINGYHSCQFINYCYNCRDEPTQLAALKICQGMLQHLSYAHLSELLPLLTAFGHHSSQQCRLLMYDIFIWIYTNLWWGGEWRWCVCVCVCVCVCACYLHIYDINFIFWIYTDILWGGEGEKEMVCLVCVCGWCIATYIRTYVVLYNYVCTYMCCIYMYIYIPVIMCM